jgi:hypothetical protein
VSPYEQIIAELDVGGSSVLNDDPGNLLELAAASAAQLAGLATVYAAARASGCIFPAAQACEAIVESAWVTSQLGRQDNNLFGMKQHAHPEFGTVNLPTREYLGHRWIVENDAFVKYPTVAACFADRQRTLQGLAPHFPHYAAALAARTPEDFLTAVSQTWSTDPHRAATCIAILHANAAVLA